MRILTADCETFDPLLKTYGAGWVFKYHYPEVEFEVLMVGCIDAEGGEHVFDPRIPEQKAALLALIKSHDALLMHNAAYDLGCLRYLYREEFDITKYFIYDTMILCKLDRQDLMSYSLENLALTYKIEETKRKDILDDYAWRSGIYKEYVRETQGISKSTRPSDNVLHSFVMSDLRRYPFKVVAEYNMYDNRTTLALFKVVLPRVNYRDLTNESDIIKVCLDAKTWGIRIDLLEAKQLSEEWIQLADKLKKEALLELQAPENFNINSGIQLGKLLEERGIKVPRTAKGSYEIKAEWLERHPNSSIQKIARYRKALKSNKDFVQKLIDYQQAIPEKYRDDKIGWLYPTMKPYGATLTGRFTSGGGQGCKELNVLAVSRKNEEFGAPIRKLFLAHEGEKLICCDFSNQEPRLQVHYAKLLKCGGTDAIVKAWNDDPKMKYHQKVADLTKLDYDVAKMVTLGLAYDMRAKGLSERLGMSVEEAQQLINQYHRLMPFMSQLQMICAKSLLKMGYVRTIGGRKLFIDKAYQWGDKLRTQERKGMSKLIQGSAADQTIKAMIEAWKYGLKVLLAVHDEIVVSSNNFDDDAQGLNYDLNMLQSFMEFAYQLAVPVVAEGGIGDNWGEAK